MSIPRILGVVLATGLCGGIVSQGRLTGPVKGKSSAVQHLKIANGPNGQIVRGLFGLFPPVSLKGSCGQASKPLSNAILGFAAQPSAPPIGPACGTTKCNYGYHPAGSGNCGSPLRSVPENECGDCVNWVCANSYPNPGCCGQCIGDSPGPCSGCMDVDAGCKKL
jgi:hypothetical protein